MKLSVTGAPPPYRRDRTCERVGGRAAGRHVAGCALDNFHRGPCLVHRSARRVVSDDDAHAYTFDASGRLS